MKRSLESHDIVLAAALKVMGYRLEKIEKQGNRGIFHFAEVDDDALNDFNLGKSLVEPVAFNNAIKALTTAARRII